MSTSLPQVAGMMASGRSDDLPDPEYVSIGRRFLLGRRFFTRLAILFICQAHRRSRRGLNIPFPTDEYLSTSHLDSNPISI